LYSLNQICASGYWNDHYLFGKKSKQSEKKYLGAEFINRLIINVLIPLKFAHAYSLGRHNEMEETMELLEKIKPETNGIIKNWRKSGIYPKNAFQTQALLHLYKNYCKSFRCLDCHLGLRHITEA
jgi:hypothetical protein